MKDNRMDIAIIDGSIHNIFDVELYRKKILKDNILKNDIHATTCYLILKKYAKNFRCSNVCLLGSNNGKDIFNLYNALNWCFKNNILLVNLSFGTTHFKDFPHIQKTINYFANKGMIFVCATSNDGMKTYPASLSSVIGVKTSNCKTLLPIFDIYLGIDFIAPSTHEVDVFGDCITTIYSNSYAAPYVTAKLSNLIIQNKYPFDIKEIKKTLLGKSYHQPFSPDWISNAIIIGNYKKSKANYYFHHTDNLAEIEKVDTIIICDNRTIDFDIKKKNLVFLFNDTSLLTKNILSNAGFCWTPLCKKKQITAVVPSNDEICIPVVSIVIDDTIDKFYLLTQLNKYFSIDNYNTYIICEDSKSVLYNLEYIPIEFLINSNRFINTFIYEQTKYQQSDLIIFCTCKQIKNNIECDFEVTISNLKSQLLIILKNKSGFVDKLVLNFDEPTIFQILYNKLINLLS